jgi:Tfp pilus assembly protein PilN
MDWKKDYKVSDLFRRNDGQDGKDQPPAGPGGPAKSETSMWKKEIKFSGFFRRKRTENAPKEQLALPAPGDTLTEAPTAAGSQPAPSTPSDPPTEPGDSGSEHDAGTGAVVASAPTAEAPAEPAGEPEHAQVDQTAQAEEVADAVAAAAAAAAVAAAAAEEPVASGEAAAEVSTDASAETPSEPQAAPVAAETGKKERRFGRKQPKSPESGPARREHQPGPSAGHASGRRPARGGQLPQVPLMKALNLLPQDIKLPKTTLRPKVAQFAVLGVAALVAAGMAFFWWSENQRLEERRSTLEDKQAELALLQAEAEAPTDDDGTALAGEALSRATALSGAIDARVGWDRLLRELSLTLPDNVWFESMVTNNPNPAPQPGVEESVTAPAPLPVGPSTLTITGYAMTEDDVAQLLARLGVVPEFSGVQLEVATEDPDLTENVFSFTVIATMKPLPGGTP